MIRGFIANNSNTFVSLYPTYRKPFDLIFQGRQQKAGVPGRGGPSEASLCIAPADALSSIHANALFKQVLDPLSEFLEP